MDGREDKDLSEKTYIEGRNEVIEAFRSGRTIARLYMLDGSHDGKLDTIRREAKKAGLRIDFVDRKRLDDMSETGNHQGVIAKASVYGYAQIEDILKAAREKNEDPFIILLDGVEDPHNLGAIIRTANVCGAHGVHFVRLCQALLTTRAFDFIVGKCLGIYKAMDNFIGRK